MKKAALLILLPSFICAMQAPRGITMDRATDCLKQGAQKAEKVAAHYVDQTVCCGCFENKMRAYLDDDHSIPNREKTACGCIGYNVGYSLNEFRKALRWRACCGRPLGRDFSFACTHEY